MNVRRLPVRRHQGAGLPVYLGEYGAFLLRSVVRPRPGPSTPPLRPGRGPLPAGLPGLRRAAAEARRRAGPAGPPRGHARVLPRPLPQGRQPDLLQAAAASRSSSRSRWPTSVLTVNEPLAERLRRRGADPARLTVVMNSPDLGFLRPAAHPRRDFMADGVLRLVYAGAITPTYELDVVLRAIGRIAARAPDAASSSATLYGRGDAEASLEGAGSGAGHRRSRRVARAASRSTRWPARSPRPTSASPPTRLDAYSEVSLSTKVLEYGAMEKPVVATRLPTVELYFGRTPCRLYEPGDPASLARAILRSWTTPRIARLGSTRTAARVGELGWAHQAVAYHAVVERLTERRKRTPNSARGKRMTRRAFFQDRLVAKPAHSPRCCPCGPDRWSGCGMR